MRTKEFKQITKNLGGVISKNSPTILTTIAVGGLVTTVILAVKATPKAIKLLADAAYEQDPVLRLNDLRLDDMIKITWKCYIPAAAVGTTTIACIIGANSINLRRNAALGAVYSLTEAAFKEYQAKVTETIGKGKETKIRDEIAQDRILKNPVNNAEVIFTGKGEVLCYDSMSGRYFKSNIEAIRRTENEQNRNLMQEMFISLNEMYYELGLAPTKLGNEMGWSIDNGLIEFDFSSQLTEQGEPCLVLDYDVSPKFGFGDA